MTVDDTVVIVTLAYYNIYQNKNRLFMIFVEKEERRCVYVQSSEKVYVRNNVLAFCWHPSKPFQKTYAYVQIVIFIRIKHSIGLVLIKEKSMSMIDRKYVKFWYRYRYFPSNTLISNWLNINGIVIAQSLNTSIIRLNVAHNFYITQFTLQCTNFQSL